ncbi:MAG: DUF58 domain-containing protein [Bdellovibrionales bacterium]|nr:DUF58 domain-containing protein [Bdellovibrionales bacterium]
MSIPPEVLKKVKLLELSTKKLVNEVFSGEYNSALKGQGMTFSEFREYVPGDDVRDISWPLTARTGKPYIKKYDEEREMMVMLVVDVSGSNDFGSKQYLKGEVINHLAAILGYAAKKNNDPVGLLLFSDQVELYLPPKKGQGQVHRIIQELYYFKPRSKKTNLAPAIDHLLKVLKKRAHLFIFSDFIMPNFSAGLKLLGAKHDAIAIHIQDPSEQELPSCGLLDVVDAETGETVTVNTSSQYFKDTQKQKMQEKFETVKQNLRLSQIDIIPVKVGSDIVAPLITFFKRRSRR